MIIKLKYGFIKKLFDVNIDNILMKALIGFYFNNFISTFIKDFHKGINKLYDISINF